MRHLLTTIGAVAVTAHAAGCASTPARTGTADAAGFVGYQWRIIEVRHGASHVTIPAALGGSIAFARDRTLYADDSINGYFGHYRVGQDGSYRPLDVGSTLVGWVGHDRARRSLISAVEALTQSNVVTATVGGDRLRLSTAGYMITCSKIGTQPNDRPPSPTATPS